jgi:hypothetical protein
MDDFGDVLGGIGDLLGGLFGVEAGAEGVRGAMEMFGGERGRDREVEPYVYERYLCGGPKQLNINDR